MFVELNHLKVNYKLINILILLNFLLNNIIMISLNHSLDHFGKLLKKNIQLN